jgi:D,D-heptose 1,7-bisphosphate phosphatase
MTRQLATVRQCAILVGGLGTRLGALTASLPKPLLPCGDRPFLAWLLRELSRFGVTDVVLLSGHLSAEITASLAGIAAGLPIRLRLSCSAEPSPAGTGGALLHARHLLDERFLLVNGDSLLDGNLAALLADAANDGPDVIGRLALRALPDASRYGVVTLDGDRVTAFAERPAAGVPGTINAGTINAGIYLLRRDILDHLAPVCSLERDVLPRLAAAGALRGTPIEGWFIDIGIPADLACAQHSLPTRLHRPALFLDRDGVINRDLGYVGSRERFHWTDTALAGIRAATDAGWHVFVVTNQSGVARGHYGEDDVRALHAWMADEVRRAGGTIDDVRYCPFHLDAALPAYRQHSDWRKPAPGMLLDLIRAWELDPAACVLIGDQPTDLQAAAAAGVGGHLLCDGDLCGLVKLTMQKRSVPLPQGYHAGRRLDDEREGLAGASSSDHDGGRGDGCGAMRARHGV